MKKNYLYLLLSVISLVMTSCAMSEKTDTGGNVSGQGGSTGRFTISGDYLYTVDQSSLHSISLADAEHPKEVANKPLGIYTETIFPYQNSLLLGTETGMFVFDLSDPASPQQTAYFQHIRACDPVVAENGFAYVTLNMANQRCTTGKNELQILNISNPSTPFWVTSVVLSSPLGLDIHNDTLYVCDQGLRVFDVSNKLIPVEISYLGDIQAKDVIYLQGRLIVIAADGLYQYQQTVGGLQEISSIPIQP